MDDVLFASKDVIVGLEGRDSADNALGAEKIYVNVDLNVVFEIV